jgi:parallel beta-helix repeat protein
MLVTRNIITNNPNRGIRVGDSITVTNNTVNFNEDGIVVGSGAS